ncbi:hypothetical protein [Clostridium grantii]|uniref:Uncharacterized protein n=1 Tax=Clostridium grantii DSM 8605 TaxID=1121316 RepID=A0A1M5S9D5_9CLOT|nr:hypothetical protein [Clostridium grantii]SHH35109.1 hypothetical protein SAMN02745207_00819 [Clostridium grantii DSM 8605]
MGMESTKVEVKFLNQINKYPDKVYLAVDGADQEGFEYFGTKEYTSKPGAKSPSIKNKLIQMGPKNAMKMLGMIVSHMPMMMKGINGSYKDIGYLVEGLKKGVPTKLDKHDFLESVPNDHMWEELNNYAWDVFYT